MEWIEFAKQVPAGADAEDKDYYVWSPVCNRFGKPIIGNWRGGRFVRFTVTTTEIRGVTHWMPAPEPPK